MQLKDFIKNSLVEINQAISESNDALKGSGAVINPRGVQINSVRSKAYARQSQKNEHIKNKVVQKIDFDVAVYVQNDGKTKGGAKISVLSIGVNAGKEVKSMEKAESRLKFSIPVIYPEGTEKGDN